MGSKAGTRAGSGRVGPKTKGNQPKVWIGGIFRDGGGYVISFDRSGRISIKPVPPWQPDIARLTVIGNLVETARKVKSHGMRKELNALAERMAAEALSAL